MAEERTQSGRLWLWVGAAILLILVFFAARFLLRERLPVREAQVSRAELINTVPTNGRVEPEVNYQINSPVATTVKAVYVQQGDQVPAGKLLMVLDDLPARARMATAESGVKAAEAALEAATHNGTQQERQMAASDTARAQLDRDQASHDLDALTKLKQTGAASASGWIRPRPLCTPPAKTRIAATRPRKWHGRRRLLPMRRPVWPRRGRLLRRHPSVPPWRERSMS
jgi:HlyD family secretion protein